MTIAVATLLVLSACSTADWPSSWAGDTATDVCGIRYKANHAVAEFDGETVLISGVSWSPEDDAKLGVTRVNGSDAVPGLDPATGTHPDKVLCLQSGVSTDCPDGSPTDSRSKSIRASLHSIALESEIDTTEVQGTLFCDFRTESGGVELASTGRNAQDAYDVDQVFCELFSCVINDDLAATITELRAGDPRAEVCGFDDPFIDGVIQLEDGSVYVAHELGYRDAMSDTTPALDVPTERTLCVSAETSGDKVSCGEYYFEGQVFGGVEVMQRGIAVTAAWYEGDATEPAASTSSVYHSECTEEISVVTTTYGSTTIRGNNLDDRVESSTFTAENLLWVAEDLQQWAETNAGAADISQNDCGAIANMNELERLQRRLDGYTAGSANTLVDSPSGLTQDIEDLQNRTSTMFDGIDEDSPLFNPVFELWYIAHFDWPVIDTFADPNDSGATEEDFELTLMGMPARVGLVTMSDPTFATRHETVSHLAAIYREHC